MLFFRGIDKQGSPTLTETVGNVVGGVILFGIPILAVIFWRSILAALSSLAGFLSHLRDTTEVEIWILPALFLLPLVLLHLWWYARLYRRRTDTFFGLDFTWFYSFPMGGVTHIRAFCPHCRKPAPEPTESFGKYDNYVCRNCNYNTTSRGAEHMKYPWHSAIPKKVDETRYKKPT